MRRFVNRMIRLASCVFDCRENVLPLEIRIVLENFLVAGGGKMCNFGRLAC